MTELAAIKAELRQLLGADYGVGVTNPRSSGNELFPEERPAVSRALNKRISEFAAGRAAARSAMRDLDITAMAIPMATDRSPIWPEGLVGSITHCDEICVAVVARRSTTMGIGIDVEPNTPLEADLEQVICTNSERGWLDTQLPENRGLLVKKIFCTKESIYKALYPITRELVDFDAIELSFPLCLKSRATYHSWNGTIKLDISYKTLELNDFVFTCSGMSKLPSALFQENRCRT